MTNSLTLIEQKLTSPDVTNRLIVALGLPPNDEKAQSEAFRYASSVLAEIRKVDGDPKRSLSGCTPDSIIQSMIDAANFKLAIDGKQHAHLVKYGNNATLQIGYRGYIAKISEHFKDADFTAEAVFKGDVLAMSDNGGFQTYTLSKADAFADGWQNLQGVVVRLSYSKGGERFQKVTAVSKSDLEKIRKSAKQDFVWNQWPIEKAKAAAIKRACKIQFADVMGLQEVIRYDNEMHFTPIADASPTRSSIIDNINKTVTPPTIEHEPTPEPEPEPTKYKLKTRKAEAEYTLEDWKTQALGVLDKCTEPAHLKAFEELNREAIAQINEAAPEVAQEIVARLK